MPLAPFRFTIRRMMIAVAIVALGLGADASSGRSEYCRRMARIHADGAERMSQMVRNIESGLIVMPSPAHTNAVRKGRDQEIALSREYQRAQWRPWLSVPREFASCAYSVEPIPTLGGPWMWLTLPVICLIVCVGPMRAAIQKGRSRGFESRELE